jgi:hypothetical protein
MTRGRHETTHALMQVPALAWLRLETGTSAGTPTAMLFGEWVCSRDVGGA